MKHYLNIFLSILLISCGQQSIEEAKFKFSTSNLIELEKEVQCLIDSINSPTPSAIVGFQKKQIKWWNIRYPGKIKGTPNIFDKNTPLNQIKQLDNLFINQLVVSGDTIKGIINFDKWYYPNNTTGMDGKKFCMDTNYIEMILQNGKISEILNHNQKSYSRISLKCFYMDHSEIQNYSIPFFSFIIISNASNVMRL